MGIQVISRIDMCQLTPKNDLLQSPFPGRIHNLLVSAETANQMARFGGSLSEGFKSQ